jgi:hypothetical protein
MRGVLYVDSDNAVRWDGLYDEVEQEFVNDAVITFITREAEPDGEYDDSGAQPANSTGSLAYVTSSDGDYVGTLQHTAALVAGRTYWVEVTMTASGGRQDKRYLRYTASRRGYT